MKLKVHKKAIFILFLNCQSHLYANLEIIISFKNELKPFSDSSFKASNQILNDHQRCKAKRPGFWYTVKNDAGVPRKVNICSLKLKLSVS